MKSDSKSSSQRERKSLIDVFEWCQLLLTMFKASCSHIDNGKKSMASALESLQCSRHCSSKSTEEWVFIDFSQIKMSRWSKASSSSSSLVVVNAINFDIAVDFHLTLQSVRCIWCGDELQDECRVHHDDHSFNSGSRAWIVHEKRQKKRKKWIQTSFTRVWTLKFQSHWIVVVVAREKLVKLSRCLIHAGWMMTTTNELEWQVNEKMKFTVIFFSHRLLEFFFFALQHISSDFNSECSMVQKCEKKIRNFFTALSAWIRNARIEIFCCSSALRSFFCELFKHSSNVDIPLKNCKVEAIRSSPACSQNVLKCVKYAPFGKRENSTTTAWLMQNLKVSHFNFS